MSLSGPSFLWQLGKQFIITVSLVRRSSYSIQYRKKQ